MTAGTRPRGWRARVSQPVHEIAAERDVVIVTRDGVKLTADVYRPAARGRFPALVAFQPFGKDHEEMAMYFPPQARPNPLWDGTIEGGDTRYLVSRGYAHVVVDARGTGASEGVYDSWMGSGGGHEGPDAADAVEWAAEQPWCDGNVGMVGISYLASMQLLAAAQQPPHLKAIFGEGGHYDPYEFIYQGGIMWMMGRAVMEGRGGDGSVAVGEPRSFMRGALSDDEFARRISERLEDPDVRFFPNFHQILRYPETHPLWLDFILNPVDGDFYWAEGKAHERFAKVEIPAHFGAQFGRGWVIDGTIDAYLGAQGPKRLALRPPPPMQERPFHEFHDEIVRWYDHWLKGNDTGLLEEAPVQIYLQGANVWLAESRYPLPGTEWQDFFLRSRNRLLRDPEPFDAGSAPPDGFYQAPLHVTDATTGVTYTTPPFEEETMVVGPGALYLHASIDTEDTNWIVAVSDVAPDGRRTPLTTGWLKASHRELDEGRSEHGSPRHPHTRSVPVPPGEIVEYAIRIYPLANVFRRGHALELTIKSVEAPHDVSGLLPPDSIHLNSARATTHKIHRDSEHPSRLVLPVVEA